MIFEILVGRNTPSIEETFGEIFRHLRQMGCVPRRHAQIWPNSEKMPGKFQNLAAKFFKGLTQNSTSKLKVEIQFYTDSENFMKKY